MSITTPSAMHLVCLMAGVSSRLYPLTERSHKALLPVNDRRLLDYQLETFRKAGMTSATFVLGHGAPEMERCLGDALLGQSYRTTYNPEYSEKNLDWSAYLALTNHSGPLIYYEGDLLVPPSLLAEVNANPSDICLAIDSTMRSPRVDLIVTAHQGNVRNLLLYEHGSAPPTPNPSVIGELVCLLKLSERGRKVVTDQLASQSFVGGIGFYDVLERSFDKVTTSFVDLRGRPWVEVDNVEDLERARQLADDIVRS